MTKSGSNQTITCPLCKDVSPIPSGGLKEIKNNYYLTNLVSRIDQVDLQSACIQLDEAAPIIYCKTHPRNVIHKYCVDCDLADCGTCLLRDHRQHKLVDLEEQAKISKQQLKGVLQETDVLIKLIDEQIQDSEKHEKQSTDDIQRVKRQINKVIEMNSKLINLRLTRKLQLFNSLDKIQEQKEKVMITVHDGQEFSKIAVTSLRSYSDNMLRHGRDFDWVQQAGDIQSRLVSVRKIKIPAFVWSCHDFKTTSSQGDIVVADVSVTREIIDTEAVDRCKIPLIEQVGVIALEVMNQTVWVVHQGQSSVHAYPVTSPHQPQALSIKGLSQPASMVRFPPGQSQLVISDYVNKQLLWIKLVQRNEVWRLTSQRSVKVKYRPCGLGVRDNQLLVCDLDDNVIHVLSTSGKEKHRVNMPQGVRSGKAVAQLTSPGFVIMDDINNQVVLVTERGEIQHTYRGQERFVPGDIVRQGHSIYVTDWRNHRVDELSVDGRHVRQLIRGQDMRQPIRMCGDDTGRLYIAQDEYRKNEVWVIETTTTPTDTQATPGDRILTQQTNMNLSVTWCD